MALRKPLKAGADPEAQADRARGVLMGLAVGDALGVTNEGRRSPVPAFPELVDGLVKEPIGGGPGRLRPGQGSDATMLAVCAGMTLREVKRLEPEEAARRYTAWRDLKLPTTTVNAAVLDQIKQSKWAWQTAGRDHWLKNGKRPSDNGSLVRTAPIGVFHARSDADRAKASLEDSALTHFDPTCQLACAALNGAIARAITSVKPPTVDDLFEGANTALSVAGATLGQTLKENVRDVLDATAMLKDDLAVAKSKDPRLYGPEFHLNVQVDNVRVTFRLAFWEAANAPTFEAALLDVANRGGDSGSNAAVTGALCGALHGEAKLPDRWRKAVLEAPSPLRADAYHPRHLIPLADAVGHV